MVWCAHALVAIAIVVFVSTSTICAADSGKQPSPPNLLVILADDLGYADVGFQGCRDIPTPNLDALARSGVRCTNGYVTHPFCSPTRAGMLTGATSNGSATRTIRNGCRTIRRSACRSRNSLCLRSLKTVNYATGCVGKWHLGAHPVFHPNRRGFDEYFGLLGGGHVYLPEVKGGVEYSIPMDRNGKSEPLAGYLTEVLGHEAVAFIERHRIEPWFLYLAFNAPHTPLQATEEALERVKHIEDETRRKYAALVVGLDDAVGEVREALARAARRRIRWSSSSATTAARLRSRIATTSRSGATRGKFSRGAFACRSSSPGRRNCPAIRPSISPSVRWTCLRRPRT